MCPLAQQDLFGWPDELRSPDWPAGFVYRSDFLTPEEETMLLGKFGSLAFRQAAYRGWTARRQTVHFGSAYDFDALALDDAPEMPDWLQGARDRCAAWLGVRPSDLRDALVSRYERGTPLGWHRDVPEFDAVVGVSLAGSAQLRFRRYEPEARNGLTSVQLRPRSAYILRGASRWDWQHSVAPTEALRYSITFRTRRADRGQAAKR